MIYSQFTQVYTRAILVSTSKREDTENDMKILALTQRGSEALLAAVIIARSTSLLLLKLGLADMGAFTLMSLRFTTAGLILLALFRRRIRAAGRAVFLRGAIIGAVFFAVLACESTALRHTSTSTTSFLENTAVVIVPLLTAIITRRAPGRVTMLSALTSVAGVALLTLRSGFEGFGPGELICLATAVLYACAIIVTGRLSRTGDTLVMGIGQVCTIAVLASAAAMIFETPALPARAADWGIVLALAVVCTIFGFTLQPVAQSGTTAERAAMFCALSPLSAGVLGVVFLHESLGVSGLLGAALILSGILLPNLPVFTQRRPESRT